MKSRILQIFILFYSIGATAQTTIENFSYGTPTGTIADSLRNPLFGGNVWRRHNATGGGPVLYDGTSLSYPGYSSSGTGGSAKFLFASSTREDINRSAIPYSSGNVYVSFLMKITVSGGTTGDYFFHIMDTSLNTTFRGRIFIKDGSAANTYNIGLTKGGTTGPAYTTTNYKLDSTILVVLKYSFRPNTTSDDTAYAFIFTSGIPTAEPTTPTLTSLDIATTDLATFNSVCIRQGTASTSLSGTIDGIRSSNSWFTSALPVKMLAFNARVNAENTYINWSTSSEINNKGFELERSINGKDFKTMGFVKGMGNSNNLNQYSFIDDNNESAFYRLKQIDFDGQFEYSNIISTKNKQSEIEITPNPFKDEITILNEKTITKTEIIDITGKVVLTVEQNSNKAIINTASLNNGIYYLKIYNNNELQTEKIIKSN